MNFPENLFYTETHEWVLVEGDVATVGITEHAQNELSELVYVELPSVGKVVNKGESVAVVESVKAASDIYAPLSGEVIEVNSELPSNPSLVNAEPYGRGWLLKLKLSNPTETSNLLSAQNYRSLLV